MRVFIASGDWSFRSALLLLVESEPGLVVIGMSGRADGLSTMVRALQPDVLLLDHELARQGIDDLVSDLNGLQHPPAVIVLGSDARAEASSLAAGADAFIMKNVPPDELLPILRRMRSAVADEVVSLPAGNDRFNVS